MDNKWIKEAIEFYNINEKYEEKCYECYKKIVQNEEQLKRFNDIEHKLYEENYLKIKKLWSIKNVDEMFGKNSDEFVTNLMILRGYEYHKSNIKKYSLKDEQINIHKKRTKECFENDLIYRKYNGIRISQMLWATYFIRVRLIEIGRLQYEYENTENNISTIKIHIPKGKKLDIEQVKQSIEKSKTELKQIFNLNKIKYICNSWLLSNQIYNLLDKNSNIAQFHRLFSIKEGENCNDDILNFVYEVKKCESYRDLAENTTLQKKIKEQLINGHCFYLGLGTLK